MYRVSFTFIIAAALSMAFPVLSGCEPGDAAVPGGNGDTDTDTDTDSDTGSSSDGDADTDTDTDGDTDSETDNPMSSGCDSMDILYIVDHSASMGEEQANMEANFPAFVQVLNDYVALDNTMADYRIGVTNIAINGDFGGCETTMGMNGELLDGVQYMADCGLGDDPWIEGPTPDVSSQFTCVAGNPIPAGGGTDCGKEMPLAVIRQFGDKLAAGQPNEGFYRKDLDSLLVIVIMTDEDEDEFSTADAQGTKDYLDTLAGGEDRYVTVTIAGPNECTSTFGDAQEAVMLKEFTDLVPNGYFGNICEGDLTTSLSEALALMTVACEELVPIE